jgi:hypothetical protein
VSPKSLSIAALFFCGICLGLGGCASAEKAAVQKLPHGYQLKTYPQDAFEKGRRELEYCAADGKTRIVWPAIGPSLFLKSGKVLFIAQLEKHQRLFLYYTDGTLVDITDEAVAFWAIQSGKDPNKAIRSADFIWAQARDEKLFLRFLFWNDEKWPELELTMEAKQAVELATITQKFGVSRRLPYYNIKYVELSLPVSQIIKIK